MARQVCRPRNDREIMHLSTTLDLDVVAHEADDRVTLLLDLVAPAAAPAPGGAPPARRAVQVVLDRSGSMSGDRLEAALDAIRALVVRLDPQDAFGLVAFDDEVSIDVPAGPLTDKAAVLARIASILPGGMTNLSGGYLRGLQEAERATQDGAATLLLLSDGHANRGVVEHEALATLGATGRKKNITTSTIGIGLDYDESLMAAVATGGAGDTEFAEGADDAGAALARLVDGLLEGVAQAATLIIRPTGDVDSVRLFNDLPAAPVDGGIMVELGDFVAGEERKLLLELDVPAMAALGLAQVAELELRWVELPSLTTHVVTLPVHVNVVPGDQAAGRIPDPKVRSELAFQNAQRAKREATEALRRGDHRLASLRYGEAAAALPPEHADEAAVLHDLAMRADHDDPRRTAKHAQADWQRKNRGRRPR